MRELNPNELTSVNGGFLESIITPQETNALYISPLEEFVAPESGWFELDGIPGLSVGDVFLYEGETAYIAEGVAETWTPALCC